ncbi:hypothetical protein B0T10DRAFT_519626 [Thelonectria olida]|uniref:NACHT domain-containing protein n=1 Tax=Thelonectria olida TaxID=1576542 RepID=A0A9P9AK01_9HYPO|nr:hypothetical protein B0T10DRAFT_519626 [Thelonectria olida]
MAEVGTLIAIVQLADRVIGLCVYWIEGVRDAPADLRSILLETSMLQTIFKHIEFLISCDNTVSAAFSNLSKPDGPLEHCHRILTSLIDLFPDGGMPTRHASSSAREKVTAMAARLAWPFKEPKARKLLEELGRYKTAITLAITAESTQDIKTIKEKAIGMYDMLTESQRNEFCRWLQSTDPSPLHNRSRKLVEDGTCNWMLRLPEWADWLAATYRCLWIHGIPGAGKTVLASYLVDTVASHCHDELGPKCAALYYYCYFGHNQDESAPLLRWLVTQLCRRAEAVPAETYAIFKQRCEPSLPKLLNALATILDGFQTIYVIVDAVDESKPRDDLLKTLRDLGTDPRFSKIQLLVTSREYLDIERVFEEISKPVSMSNSFIELDILLYVRSSLRNNPKFKRWNSQLRGEVETILSTRAKGMFRWVVCQLDRLQRLKGESRIIKHALATLPRTLDETYERIFLEISDEERSFVRQCLRWIHFHNEQYDNNIPCAILLQALEFSNDEQREPKDECPYDEQDLKEICGCLVHVSPGYGFKIHDQGDELIHEAIPVVSFAHYTVREFLDSDRISTSAVAFFMLEKQIELDIQRRIFLTALEFRASNFENLSLEDDSEDLKVNVFRNLTGNFRSYCVVSAIFSISSHPSEIISYQDLNDHLFDMLNPLGAHAGPILQFLYLCQLHWRSTDKPSRTLECAMVLFSILVLADNFEPLAKGLFQKMKQSLDFVHTPLHFGMELEDADNNITWCEFNGRMVEFFAQAPGGYGMGERLEFILDQGTTLHNPTAVLYSYVGRCRRDQDHEDRCDRDPRLLNRILELGCDPNGAEYAITPLQIAVAAFDFVEVETLLRAGADPNRLGDPDGVRWSGIFGNFYHLEGMSALFICQDGSRKVHSEDERQMLEALLLQHGAESFAT